jgi:cob(I)alamin adenosyltransferase
MVREYGSERFVRIYTKTGDDGMTGLLGSGRVYKDDVRVEAYGTVDELNASLGVARAHGVDSSADGLLYALQNALFVVGSALADPVPSGPFHHSVTVGMVEQLEQAIDEMEAELEPLTQFILPGGHPAASQVHLARTICRRAERLVVHLSHHQNEDVPKLVIMYLNRLSDLLFVLARAINHRAGIADTCWKGIDDGGRGK